MPMQGYDFLELNRRYNCSLQLGGDDQWSNILAGVDLIRRVEGKSAYGMTFNLLTTSEGKRWARLRLEPCGLILIKLHPMTFISIGET